MRSPIIFIALSLVFLNVIAKPLNYSGICSGIGNNCTLTKLPYLQKPFKPTESKLASERPLHISKYYSRRGTYIQNTKQRLNKYVKGLKGYFSEKFFDAIRFEAQLSKISDELFNIDKLMEEIIPPHEELSKQFKFTRDMYRAMVTFNEFRKNKKNISAPEDKLLSDINTLSVQGYGLYTPQGKPDYSTEGYDGYLAGLITRWNNLKKEKDSLRKSSSIIQLILDVDFNKVKKSLWELAGYPIDEEFEDLGWTPFRR